METLIVQPKNKKQLIAIEAVLHALNVTFKKEQQYNQAFVEQIRNGEEDLSNGRVIRIKDVQDIWGSIL